MVVRQQDNQFILRRVADCLGDPVLRFRHRRRSIDHQQNLVRARALRRDRLANQNAFLGFCKPVLAPNHGRFLRHGFAHQGDAGFHHGRTVERGRQRITLAIAVGGQRLSRPREAESSIALHPHRMFQRLRRSKIPLHDVRQFPAPVIQRSRHPEADLHLTVGGNRKTLHHHRVRTHHVDEHRIARPHDSHRLVGGLHLGNRAERRFARFAIHPQRQPRYPAIPRQPHLAPRFLGLDERFLKTIVHSP